jgi:hypothetical protein
MATFELLRAMRSEHPALADSGHEKPGALHNPNLVFPGTPGLGKQPPWSLKAKTAAGKKGLKDPLA